MLLTVVAKAQYVTLSDSANFYDYLHAFYESSRYNVNDTTEGGEQKQYERLKLIWASRLYPHGDFSVANKAIINYAENFQPANSRPVNPSWVCLGPSDNPSNTNEKGVGQIHRITFDPGYDGVNNQIIYAATGHGGLWRTEDDGMNWENDNTDQLKICSVADVAVDPFGNDTLFIATGIPDEGITLKYSSNWGNTNPIYTIGIYRSTDYGETWNEINTGFIDDFYNNGGTVRKLTIDFNNPNVVFAATSNGVYRTTNALADIPVWSNVFTGIDDTDGDFRSVEFKPGSSDTLYASSSNIFKSTDGGTTWEVMTGENTGLDFEALQPFIPYRINLAVTPAASENLYAYIWGEDPSQLPNPDYNENTVMIYIYSNGYWTQYQREHGYNAKEWMGFAVSPVDEDTIVAYGDFNGLGVGIYGPGHGNGHGFKNYSGYVPSGGGFYADVHDLVFQPVQTQNPLLFCANHGGITVLNIHNRINGILPVVEYRNKGLQNHIIWSFDDSEFEPDVYAIADQDIGVFFHENNSWKALEPDADAYSVKSSKVNQDLFFLSYGKYL